VETPGEEEHAARSAIVVIAVTAVRFFTASPLVVSDVRSVDVFAVTLESNTDAGRHGEERHG
jgi:hypothetical protein